MIGQQTARSLRVTERHKARTRLVLLTLIGLICPPLAGARSASVWIFYTAFVLLYSLWSLRLVRNFSGDRRLGYILCLTDTAIVLPLLVWTSSPTMQVGLLLVCLAGLAVTYWADRSHAAPAARTVATTYGARVLRGAAAYEDPEEPLERALRMRLRVFEATGSRFALVILRVVRFEEMRTYYGEDAADLLLSAVGRRGLRLLGHDAQHFFLPGGRVALVFATGRERARPVDDGDPALTADPYDVESVAMALARKVCEHLIEGRRVECVVGWASAPADGLSAEDLVYAAESGAQSSAAFRRVAGERVPVPEKTRAAAG